MELYLGTCAKVAHGAATRTAASAVAADSRQCGDGAHKTHFGEVGAAQLLDLPLGVKLPVIPGTDPLFFTTNLSEKLFRPSYGFNLTDPYCRLLENQYKSLHDPHLKAYYRRKDILRRLKKGGYITNNNKIVCSLRELNKYRQYLTNLKLDFERNYVREQKMLAKQLQKLEENNPVPGCFDVTQFQNWLLHEGTQSVRDQERLIRHRYLDMISKGLEQSERAAEEHRLLRMDREERRQREHTRRKLTLRRKIEEEWKTKEMLLLTKIAEDVKREQKLEQQRRKSREERDRKKQALLEKKMAYHLQKMQETGFKEDMDKNAFEYSGQDGAHFESSAKKKKNQDDIKLLYSADDKKAHKGIEKNLKELNSDALLTEPAANAAFQCQSSSKNVTKKLSSVVDQSGVQETATEQKRDVVITKKSSTCDEKGDINISAQNSPTEKAPSFLHSFVDPNEEKEINRRPSKSRPSYHEESEFQTNATGAAGVFSSPVVSNIQQTLLQNCVQAKVTSDELNSIIQNIMTWVVATVTSILYPAITKYEERVRDNIYPVSDDSTLSSDSSSFCSTCSEEFIYGSYMTATAKTFQAEPCVFSVDVSAKKPSSPLKPPAAQVERTVVGKTYHGKGQPVAAELKYNKTSMIYSYPKLRSYKSDSQLLAPLKTGMKESKDATTETDGSVNLLLCDKKAKAMDELKNLKNIFVNFRCHLKGETKLILESIFQEIMSDLTQAIPAISSVTAEVFVDQREPEKENAAICSLASDIVENVFKKLESAVEKKCVEIFSQEDFSADVKSSSAATGEYFTSVNEKPSGESLPCTLGPMYNIAEDMVHDILEKLMTLASLKQNELPLEDTTKHSYQKWRTDPAYTILQRASEKKSIPEHDTANLIANEEIQNLMSNIFSQSSLVGYIEEAISTILGYIQTELTNGRLIASEQTVVFLQLLDAIFSYLHREPVKANVQKSSSSSYTYIDDKRQQSFYASVYLSTFLEDVVSGVLSKIFHRVIGIVRMKPRSDSEDELFDKAEKLIHLILEEFSKAQVSVLDNAEVQLCLPPVERDVVKNIIDAVYGRVLEEYEMEIMPHQDFLNDTRTLAARITKIILTEIFDFQIHPDLIANLPFKSHSKLSENILVNRVQYDISKSRFRRQASTIYTTMLTQNHLEKIITQLVSRINPLTSTIEHPDTSPSDLNDTVIKLINEIMSIISKNAICITKHGNENQNMISEKDIQSMIDSIYADLSHSDVYKSLTKDKKGMSNIPVSKIASFIIKEIFNHHLKSFLSGDKPPLSASADQIYKQKAKDPKQKRWSFIVNSAVFLEEVISELLCKILSAFTHNVLAAENPDTAKAKTADIVTTLVKSIVLEFTTSEILVADSLDKNLYFSEEYKEMVQETVNLIYEKLLDEYTALVQVYRAIQSDPICFGRKIYHLLLEEIYDCQVQSLVSGELVSSSCSFLQADNIIRSVLNVILNGGSALPSCVTVFPRALLEDMIYKLLVRSFPPADSENQLPDEEVTPDDDLAAAASEMTDEIIKEIFEHEIRLATAMENAESTQLEVFENLVDSICNNIFKKSEFQAEIQKDAGKKGRSFLSKIAGYIMKEIMDHHLQPFLYGEDSSPNYLPEDDHASVVTKSGKETTQSSLFSATFLEDVVVDLVCKFFSFPDIKDSKKRATPPSDIVGLAIKFANALLGEFRKNEIKVLPQAEEKFCFPPVDKEIVAGISSFVYDQFIGKFGSNDIQKNDKSNVVIEMIAALAQKAISAFKIQPLFSGDWFSAFFSFLNPDTITRRVQRLPQNTSVQITRYSEGNHRTLPEQSNKQVSLSSDQKKVIISLEQDRDAMSRKKGFHTKDSSVKREDSQNVVLTSVTTIMESGVTDLMSASSAGMAQKKKEEKNKLGILTQKNTKSASRVASPATRVNRKETREQALRKTHKNNAAEKKRKSLPKNEKLQGAEVQTHFSVVSNTDSEDVVLKSDLQRDNEKNRDNTRESSIKENAQGSQLSPWKPKMKDVDTATEKTLNITQKPRDEEMIDSSAGIDMDEQNNSDSETVQNIIENIHGDVLQRFSIQEPPDFSKPRYSKSSLGNKALNIMQETGKGPTQFGTTKSLSSSVNQKDRAAEPGKKVKETQTEKENEREKEKENEKSTVRVREKEVESKATETDHPQHLPESEPGVSPAKFLEDIITETVNKLLFSSLPEIETPEKCINVSGDQNQTELHHAAMKLVSLLVKEFSDAQIKVFRPDEGNQSFAHASKVFSVPTVPSRNKELTTDEASSSIMIKNVDKMPGLYKVTEKFSSPKTPFLDGMPSIDKMLVNKVAHSSICNIFKEYGSQESLYRDINSNGENLVKRLTNAVISDLFQHQLNLIFHDEAPVSACLPLESKDLVKKVQKEPQTASKASQTTSPYTIMLPHQFLEDVISTLLSKIFSKISNAITKAQTSENKFSTELNFLQMELVSKIAAEISKNEDMIIQYVESLHPNDNEIIELVVQSIYDNLLPQFGSLEIIQNCVSSGCRLLSETIVDLVLKEVAGNQLQNYFCGALTPHQCAEVDNVVENILFNVIQTSPPQSPHAHKVSYNIIEEIAVKFLSKLLSVFPKLYKQRIKSPETEMQKITSKILNSFQEFISKSKIKLTRPAKETPTVSLADSATIEKVVNSVYTSVLKHSGSHTSVFKDLMGQSNILSDIIGFLMVKEISNSEFQPQVEEEISSSELVLEAVKIMEKVVKIVDKFKSQEHSSSKKCSILDATVLEETLALFLAKLVRSPCTSSKDTHNLSKPDLSKIASQLTKSVTAEVSRSNISLVAANPKDYSSTLEEMDMISQVVDSVYGNMLQQSGSHEELYDIKDANAVFPKVASLIIEGVSRVPLDRVSLASSYAGVFEDLDIDRIIEKTESHAEKMMDDKNKSSEDRSGEECSVVIIPHVGKRAIKVDPQIISQHLAVISVKTEPLEKMKTECLKRTGHSIEERRRASVDGRNYTAVNSPDVENRKKERRASLNTTGQLDIKPFEAFCRNSFQNVRKPDISKVELLKDVRNRKDLIIRLVVHDINQEDTEYFTEEDTIYDENEIVLGEYFGQKSIGELSEDEVKEVLKLIKGKVVSSKPRTSTSSVKQSLTLTRCSQPTSTSNTEYMDANSNQRTECNKTQGDRAAADFDVTTAKTLTETHSSRKRRSHHKKEKRGVVAEPTHHFIHRIMSTSSYNQEDLISSSSEDEESDDIPSTKILKESALEQKPDDSTGIQFISIFEGHKDGEGKASSSKEITSEAPKPSISKEGSKMLARVSSTLSKVFSRSHASIPKSS